MVVGRLWLPKPCVGRFAEDASVRDATKSAAAAVADVRKREAQNTVGISIIYHSVFRKIRLVRAARHNQMHSLAANKFKTQQASALHQSSAAMCGGTMLLRILNTLACVWQSSI